MLGLDFDLLFDLFKHPVFALCCHFDTFLRLSNDFLLQENHVRTHSFDHGEVKLFY